MAEVDTINIPDFGGVTREVATLSLALRTEDAAADSNPRGVAIIGVRRDTLVTNEVSADGDYVAIKADSRGALHVAIGAAAASIAKAEDAAHTSGDVGVPAMFVRSDTAASLGGTDGDYQPGITDSSGRLWVNIAGNLYTEDAAAASDPVGPALIAVRRDTLSTSEVSADGDNVAVKANSEGRLHVTVGTGAGSIGKAEDAAHSSGDVGVPAMSVRQDTAAALAGTDADYQPLITDATGRLHVNIGASASSIAKAEDAAHSSADVGAFVMGVRRDAAASGAGTDGDYASLNLDANGQLWVSIAGNLYTEDAAAASDPVGPALIAVRRDTLSTSEVSADGDNIALKANSEGRLHVTISAAAATIAKAEDAAHSSGDVGVMALTVRKDTIAATSGTENDYQPPTTDASGRLWTREYFEGPAWTTVWGVSGAPVASADASSATSVTDAPTAGQKIVVDKIHVAVGSNLTVTFKCETSGAVISGPHYMLANTSLELNFGGPHAKGPKLATADKKLQVQTSGAGNIAVNVAYHSEA